MDIKSKQDSQFYILAFTKNEGYEINGIIPSKFKKTFKPNESFFISNIITKGRYHLPSEIKVFGTKDYIYSQSEGLLAITKAPSNNILVSLNAKEEYNLTFTNQNGLMINGESSQKFKKVFTEGETFKVNNIKSFDKIDLNGKIDIKGTESFTYQDNTLTIINAPKNDIFVTLGTKKNDDYLTFSLKLPKTRYPEKFVVGITSYLPEGSIYSSKWSDTEIDNSPLHEYTTSTTSETTYNVEIAFNFPPNSIGLRNNHKAPGNKYLKKVTIPSGIRCIDLFKDCTNLETVYIEGNNVEEFYGSAFKNCSNLISINIPDGVRRMGGDVFSNCEKLDGIKLPDTIDFIGNGLFDGCTNLGATQDVILSNRINQIPNAVFRNCSSLRYLKLPPYCTIVESNSFSGCHSLREFKLNAGTPWIGDATFAGTYSLKEIFIPASVHHMEANAFFGSGIESITFEYGSRMTYIRDNAFEECKNLNTFEVPPSLTDLSERAFVNCNLGSVTVSPFNGRYTSRDYVGPYGQMGECNAILERRGQQFRLLHGSNSTTINSDFSQITEISNWAFSGRTEIEELDVTNVDELGASSFENAESINNLNFESLDLDLNQSRFLNCFRNCKSLTNLVIGKNVLHNLCEGIENLQSVHIDQETDTISNFAFNDCIALKNINLSELNNLRTIGDFAFGNCQSLLRISIPASVNNISYGAFYKSGLELIEVARENYVYSDNFNGVKGAIIKKVAGDPSPFPLIIQACKSTEIEDNDSYFGIASYSFAGISYEENTQLTMPRNTFRIDDYAYCNSSNCSITISESVQYMGEKVFAGWKNNQIIRIPKFIVQDVKSSEFKIAKWNNVTWSLTPVYNKNGKNATHYISEDCGSGEATIEIY